MASPILLPIPSNITSLAGPPLLGVMLNWWLFGILTVQVYIYRLWFPSDKRRVKLLVYGLFFLETAQTILSANDIFHWFVLGYGNIEILANPYTSGIDSPMMDLITGFIVQTFFCWRIWVLSGSRLLSGFIFAVVLTSLASGLYLGIQTIIIGDLLEGPPHNLNVELIVCFTGTALVDTLIAGFMTFFLLRARTESRQTDVMIRRILRLTVETNAITAGVAIASMVTFLAFRSGNYYIFPGYIFGKVYSNTALVVFNNRMVIAGSGVLSGNDPPSTRGRLIFARNKSSPSQDISSCAQNPSLTLELDTQVFHVSETSSKDFDGIWKMGGPGINSQSW